MLERPIEHDKLDPRVWASQPFLRRLDIDMDMASRKRLTELEEKAREKGIERQASRSAKSAYKFDLERK